MKDLHQSRFKPLFFIVLLFLAGVFTLADDKQPLTPTETAWLQIDSLRSTGRFVPALDKSLEMRQQAKQQQAHKELVRSWVYIVGLAGWSADKDFKTFIIELEKDLLELPQPEKAILQSYLAEMYLGYYSSYAHAINQRTEVTGDELSTDIDTWTKGQFKQKINELLIASLSNHEQIRNTKASDYKPFVDEGTHADLFDFTLYEILLERSLNIWESNHFQDEDLRSFFLTDSALFLAPAEFLQVQNPLNDNQNTQKLLFDNWQEATAFFLENEKQFQLALLTIDRLQKAREWFVGENPEEKYLSALESLYQQTDNDSEARAWLLYEQANYLLTLGQQYDNERSAEWQDARLRALAKINTGRLRYPMTLGAENLETLLERLNQKSFTARNPEVLLPGKSHPAFFQYKNVDTINLEIYKVSAMEMVEKNNFYRNQIDNFIRENQPLQIHQYILPHDADFNQNTTEALLPALDKGFYLLNYYYLDEKDTVQHRSFLQISNLAYISHIDGRSLNISITDRKKGEPQNRVNALLYNRTRHDRPLDLIRTGRSNRNGDISFRLTQNWDSYFCFLVEGSDTLFTRFGAGPQRDTRRLNQETMFSIYTDRAIYRPGQTVYFKAISYQPEGDFYKINTKRNVEVSFRDANRQIIATKNLRTNEFGSVEGSFTIPTGLLPGNWNIRMERSSRNFKVEEYRRPGFEVEFDPLEKEWQLEDTVEVSGTATTFFGSPFSTGRVSYTVTRQSRWMPFYSRFRPPFGRETEITSGYTTLENGKFIISFPAIPDYAAGKHKGQLFHYEVKADVTDESGETHSGLQTVVLGRQPFSIETNLPQKINASRFEGFFIQSNNLQGNPVNTSGELIVRKLVPHKKPFKKRPWADPTQLMIDEQIYQRLPYWESPYEDYTPKTGEIVLRQNLQIEGKIELDKSLLQQLSENTYRIEIRLAGEKGDSVKVEQDFVLFKEDTRNMPEPDFLWTHQLKSQLSKGEKPQLLMGSSVNAKIRLQAATSNGMITDEWVSLNNRKRLYTFNPGNNYTGRVTVKLSMIFENMVFEESFSYFIAPPPEYLQAEWIQKPDTLAPGSANLWELTLKNEKGEPADAEFMAVLYDASLDQLTPHKWQTSWNKRFPSVSINFRNAQSFGLENTRIRDSRHRRWSIVEPQKGDLNMFGFQTFGWYQIYMKGASMRGGRAAETYDLQEESLELSEVAVLNFQTPLIDADSDVVEKTSEIDDPAHEEEPTAIREDFAETAFFYPVLKTDENGKVQMEFDMPETLTRWKFMGLGHTQELRTLIIEHTAITHQNWMVKSFLPRWVREGDEITLTATAYNMSQQEQNGNLQIIIKDALTQKDVTFAYLQDEKNKQITIAPNNSKVVNWKVAIPGEHAFLEIEISGTAAGESDGERHLLPVLPLYVPVTESFNFYVDEKGQHHFQIPFAAKMQDEKVRPELFRLEFTPNPSWQVIFALPNLLEVQHRTADNLASQYFAISLGQHIFKQHPEIAVVLKALQQQQHSGDRNILEGFLAQHPEFKALTLQATPWVRQSIAESENLQSLLQLTDQNYVNNRKREIVRQLQNYQTSEGGFSWMPQGRPNQYITRVVVELFAKLQSQQIETTEPGLTEMLNSARNYLQQETNRQWAEFKKHEKYEERHTPVDLLNNLYALSFFTGNTNDNTTAHEILEHAKKHQSDFAPQLQALVGMTAFRYNKKEIATESIEILKAQAIRSKDRGTYWRTSAHSWRWQDAPIETHAAIVQAFLEIAPQEERLVLEVQKWLLLNKQVSAWPTTRGTTEVIWAMLKSPADMLKTEKDIRLQYGDVDWTFSGREAEPGTLYRSQTYSNTQIRSLPDKITVDAGEDGLSWGSVMYRYDTPIDHIEDYGDELKVEKAFFVQYREDGKTLSRPLAEHGNLQQGDLLISRLTLRADRDMDFLHLKDVRPPVAEPVESISGRQFSHGLSYYIAIGDEGVNLYFDRFRAGTYIIEIPVRIVHKGNVAGGNASFQSFYAPSFSAGSGGGRVRVE